MTTIPTDAATWIHDVVLPPALRDDLRDQRRQRCPCQGSASGHCQTGECMLCPRTWGWHRHGEPAPDTWITDSRGLVAVARGVSAAVWRSGRACRWLCPCRCHATVAPLFDPPAREAPRRLSAAGGNNRIASTDRLRAFDTPPPTLFDTEPNEP